jgi:hypothetical protein
MNQLTKFEGLITRLNSSNAIISDNKKNASEKSLNAPVDLYKVIDSSGATPHYVLGYN